MSSGDQTHQPMSCGDQTNQPMCRGDQTHQPMSCGDQTHRPMSCGDQTHRPMSSGDQSHQPMSCGDQTHQPMSCGDQTHQPMSCEDQTHQPMSCGGQTHQPMSLQTTSSIAAHTSRYALQEFVQVAGMSSMSSVVSLSSPTCPCRIVKTAWYIRRSSCSCKIHCRHHQSIMKVKHLPVTGIWVFACSLWLCLECMPFLLTSRHLHREHLMTTALGLYVQHGTVSQR